MDEQEPKPVLEDVSETVVEKHSLLRAMASVFIRNVVSEDSRQRKTQIPGLQDEGVRQYLRHDNTDFGSGYRADEDRPTLAIAATLATGVAAIALHRYKMANSSGYAEKVYKTIKNVFEYKSPFHVASTYRLGEMASSYLPETLKFSAHTLVERVPHTTPKLTLLGEQFQKIFGKDLNIHDLHGEMVFRREKQGSPFLKLAQAQNAAGESLVRNEHYVRFMEKGHIAGTAFRYQMPLDRAQELFGSTSAKPVVQKFMRIPVPEKLRPYVDEFVKFKRSQFQVAPNVPAGILSGVDEASKLHFLPIYGKKTGESFVKQIFERAKLVSFTLAERGHETLARTLGAGLKRGTYNSTTTMLGGLLVKRVLPVVAGIQAARYLDYKTGHHVRNAAIDIAARTHLTYGAITEMVPGLRESADFNKEAFPGPKYGPLALPATGAFVGGLYHYGKLLKGSKVLSQASRSAEFKKFSGAGAMIGLLAAIPFLPGMIGSRKSLGQMKREYSGEDQVPVRSGRYWDLGNESFEGGKISFYLPNWYQRAKSTAYVKGNYGSEEEYWGHNPWIHPFKYIKNPYHLEEQNYSNRPFPITSPAFTNVPLIGDILAATVGKIIKPPKLMHEGEWSDTNYEIGGPKLQPRGPQAQPAEKLSQEYSLENVARRQAERFFDWSGLLGFHLKTAYKKVVGDEDLTPYMQGSRQMTNLSRLYYERQFGAMVGLGMENGEQLGYSEPIRRFLINEPKTVQINEIKNQMPSWMPGKGEYAFDFKSGDPYSRIPFGYMRLPGPGLEALHPELKGKDPESYPSITKLMVLADVAPTSTKFFYYKSIVEKQASKDMGLQIELDRILQRVEEQKQSATHSYEPKWKSSPDTISGTVEEASVRGVRLKEYPGRLFKFSGVGMSAADMSAAALAEDNRATRDELVRETGRRFEGAEQYLGKTMAPGTKVTATVPVGAAEHATEIQAVFSSDGDVVNRGLLDQGFGISRLREAGPESQPMFSIPGKMLGITADRALRTPSPYFAKLWNAHPVEEEYLKNEYYGTKSRAWDKPVQDFLAPYVRGAAYHTTGVPVLSEVNAHRRDLDTLQDQMKYLQALDLAVQDPEHHSRHLGAAARTNIGANQLSSPDRLELTLPRTDRPYFRPMLAITDPERRSRILQYASPELARSLSGQWLKQDMAIAQAEGRQEVPPPSKEPVEVKTSQKLNPEPQFNADLAKASTDFQRSQEIADFFARKHIHLPEPGSDAYYGDLDYEDVKLKILQEEGYNYHDFGIFQDRAAVLHRKPYVDGAVRELSQPAGRSAEALRVSVEQMIAAAHDKNPKVQATQTLGFGNSSNITINTNYQPEDEIRRDIRRNRDKWN